MSMSLIHKTDICDLHISTPLQLTWLILPQTQVKASLQNQIVWSLWNYITIGGGVKIKKKVWKQKPIQTKSTISLTAITSYWSEWKQYHTLTKGSNNATSLGCKVAGREATLAVLVWEWLPGVPEGGPGHRGPPAHYGANDGEEAVVLCEITHVCDQPILQVFLLKTHTLWVT